MGSSSIPQMIDVVFDLDGDILPSGHAFALWDALRSTARVFEDELPVGILPLRTIVHGSSVMLAKRAKLAIRVPKSSAQQTAADLEGKQLDMDGTRLKVGKSKERELKPFPTLHAQVVTGNADEIAFMNDIQRQIADMGVAAKLICGRRAEVTGKAHVIHGYSLVIHDLKPDASLALQYRGLGTDRHHGCGIFVPYKVITGLSED